MIPRRVFVIWTNPIFHASVRLLINHPQVEWLGATSDYETAREEILNLQPDTIIVEASSSGVPKEVLKILETTPWDVRIVSISFEDNNLQVYYRERRLVVQARDLLQLILDSSFAQQEPGER